MEKRLIDTDALIRTLDQRDKKNSAYNLIMSVIIGIIERQPTLDAEEVVRCKNCKHYEIHKPKFLENCERNGYLIPMKPDDFCSYGERKDSATKITEQAQAALVEMGRKAHGGNENG